MLFPNVLTARTDNGTSHDITKWWTVNIAPARACTGLPGNDVAHEVLIMNVAVNQISRTQRMKNEKKILYSQGKI
jgi:hypothetical protein